MATRGCDGCTHRSCPNPPKMCSTEGALPSSSRAMHTWSSYHAAAGTPLACTCMPRVRPAAAPAAHLLWLEICGRLQAGNACRSLPPASELIHRLCSGSSIPEHQELAPAAVAAGRHPINLATGWQSTSSASSDGCEGSTVTAAAAATFTIGAVQTDVSTPALPRSFNRQLGGNAVRQPVHAYRMGECHSFRLSLVRRGFGAASGIVNWCSRCRGVCVAGARRGWQQGVLTWHPLCHKTTAGSPNPASSHITYHHQFKTVTHFSKSCRRRSLSGRWRPSRDRVPWPSCSCWWPAAPSLKVIIEFAAGLQSAGLKGGPC